MPTPIPHAVQPAPDLAGHDLFVPLRWPVVALVCLSFLLPWLFVRIPPIIDVPGHMGRLAVAVAPGDSALHAFFSFTWVPVLNLGSDALIVALSPALGLMGATWLVCAATPVMTALGVIAIARKLNPRGATALPWALIFVMNWPFLYGFLNYSLTIAFALLAVALWFRLEQRPALRAGLYLVLLPLLMVSHAVGGAMATIIIASQEAGRREIWRRANWTLSAASAVSRTLWPLSGVVAFVVLWMAMAPPTGGETRWLVSLKIDAVVMALRDQNIILDIGSVAAAFAALFIGRRWGARYRNGTLVPVIAAASLVVLAPSVLNAAHHIDTRLAPVALMLALALQDWSGVAPDRRRWVAVAGALLLVVRLIVTTTSFVGYDRIYASEFSALDQVRPGSRILSFVAVGCKLSDWKRHRLEHIPNVATVTRQSWVNAHWEMDGVNMLQVRYRPHADYYRDPSAFVFPDRCIDMKLPLAERSRRALQETLTVAPIDGADYLWLVSARLPTDYAGPPLDRIWSNGRSELYAVRHPVPFRADPP
jgi:hypothetical protein